MPKEIDILVALGFINVRAWTCYNLRFFMCFRVKKVPMMEQVYSPAVENSTRSKDTKQLTETGQSDKTECP